MLIVKGLRKSFDKFVAVNEASLTVAGGQTVAVIGPNGAGKSTLFKLISGQIKPDRGEIIFKGQNIAGIAAHRICRLGISLSFQIVNVFSRLTVFENVRVAVLSHQGRAMNLVSNSRKLAVKETQEILSSVGLMNYANCVSASLSHGDQKVLEIAIALGNKPELLILDEPTAGMSAEETAGVIDLIRKMARDLGITILFCEHDMDLVFSVADEIMVMQTGLTLIQGPPELVKNDRRVQEAYLGDMD
jgi:branched-chain amino acid transport system ATP-binding protein